MLSRLAVVSTFAVFATSGFAQSQPAQPEMSTHEQALTFKSSTIVVNVPVVVRDSKGSAVGNLTKDDFQLFDRGKLQTITKFAVEKSDAGEVSKPAETSKPSGLKVEEPSIPAAVSPDRFVAYIFDDAHVSMSDLTRIRDAADRHMKKVLGPKTRAAIFTTSGQTMQDFTADGEKLHETLFKLSPHPIGDEGASRDCPDITYTWADRIRNQNDQEALQFATAEAMACAGVDAGTASKFVRAAVARVIARAEQSAMVPLELLRNSVNRIAVMPGQRTLVLASPGFLTVVGTRNEQSTIIDRAIRANVVINSLDVRGLAVEAPDLSKPPIQVVVGSGVTSSALMAYIENTQHQEWNARADVMGELAAGTGGTFYHNSNDLDSGLDRVAAAPEYIYVLGFAPQNLKMDGSVHALKVSLVRNPGHYELDARRSYSAPKKLDDPAEQAKQDINDALFSREELRGIPLELHSEFFKKPDGRAKVTVVTHVDLKALHLRKAEGRNRDELTVTTALFDNNGNYAAGIQRGVDLRLKDETFDRWMANGILVQSNVEVKPGTYLVRVVVRDSEGQLMATRNGSVDIP